MPNVFLGKQFTCESRKHSSLSLRSCSGLSSLLWPGFGQGDESMWLTLKRCRFEFVLGSTHWFGCVRPVQISKGWGMNVTVAGAYCVSVAEYSLADFSGNSYRPSPSGSFCHKVYTYEPLAPGMSCVTTKPASLIVCYCDCTFRVPLSVLAMFFFHWLLVGWCTSWKLIGWTIGFSISVSCL